MAQWKPRKKYKRMRIGKEQSDTKDRKPSTKEEMDTQDEEDAKTYTPGELLSCDNEGPVNPKLFEGYTQSDLHLERYNHQAHVLTLGQRSDRGRISGGTRGDTTVLQGY